MAGKTDNRRLSELLDLWWKLHAKNLKSGAHAYRRLQIMCEQLNDPIAATFTAKDFAHYRANRLTVGRGKGRSSAELSISSQNHDLLWMKVLFNELRRLKEWNQPNLLEDVKTIKTADRELSYLSHDQIAELLTFVQSSSISAQMTKIIKICLATGARIMEAIQLKRQATHILVLQKILGHVDIKQTMAYSHFAPSHLQDAVLFNPLASKS